LLGATISVLCQHRLSTFLTQVLPCLPERLGHACHSLDDVLFAHIHP